MYTNIKKRAENCPYLHDYPTKYDVERSFMLNQDLLTSWFSEIS